MVNARVELNIEKVLYIAGGGGTDRIVTEIKAS